MKSSSSTWLRFNARLQRDSAIFHPTSIGKSYKSNDQMILNILTLTLPVFFKKLNLLTLNPGGIFD